MKCSKCSADIPDDSIFCSTCGHKVDEDATPAAIPAVEDTKEDNLLNSIADESTGKQTPEKYIGFKLSKTMIALIAGGVAVVAIVLLVAFVSMNSNGTANLGLYIRDREIFFTDFSEESPFQISTGLIDTDEEDVNNEEIANARDALSYVTITSTDATKLLYPDKIGDGEGFSLYYRDLEDLDAQPIKIASRVKMYTANETLDQIIYLSADNCALYRHNLENKEKIASDVYRFYCSKDGSIVYYITLDDDLYIINQDAPKDKIDSGISYISALSEDCRTLYYKKEEALYKYTTGETREKLVSDIDSSYVSGESADVFYISGIEDPTLVSFIKNDMDIADWESFFSDETLYLGYGELGYYDGESKATLSKFAEVLDYVAVDGRMILCFSEYDLSAMEPVALSKISEAYEESYSSLSSAARALIREALAEYRTYYCVINGTVVEIEAASMDVVTISPDGTSIYYVDSSDYETEEGDLYQIQIANDTVTAPTLLDTDVSSYSDASFYLSNEQFIYFKDAEYMNGDLYLNGRAVGYDVRANTWRYDSNSDMLYYIADWNEEKFYGSLYRYDGTDNVKIADDVNSFTIAPDGSLLYLFDYSVKNYKGDIYLYQNDESVLIDSDVVTLIDVYTISERQYSVMD